MTMPDAPAPALMALLEAAQSVLIAFAEGVEWTDDQRSAYVALDKAVKDTRPAPATPAAAAERVARADEALGQAAAALDAFPGYHAEVTFVAVWKWLKQRGEALDVARAALAALRGTE